MIITVGRKPFVGAVVDNVKDLHCGAINVDATRIKFETDGARKTTKRTPRDDDAVWSDKNSGMKKENSLYADADPRGRFPANLILQHIDGCKFDGFKTVKGNRKDTRPNGDGGRADKSQWRFRPTDQTKRGFSDADGNEKVANWICVEGCPIAKLETQSGVSRYFKVLK